MAAGELITVRQHPVFVRSGEDKQHRFWYVQNTTAPVGLLNPSQSRKGFPALFSVRNKSCYEHSFNQRSPATAKPPVSDVNDGVNIPDEQQFRFGTFAVSNNAHADCCLCAISGPYKGCDVLARVLKSTALFGLWCDDDHMIFPKKIDNLCNIQEKRMILDIYGLEHSYEHFH